MSVLEQRPPAVTPMSVGTVYVLKARGDRAELLLQKVARGIRLR